nr:NADH dehydrogenase subunit 4 [Cyamus boopis]
MLNCIGMFLVSMVFCSWEVCLYICMFVSFMFICFSYESSLFKCSSFFELDSVGLSLVLLSVWVVLLSFLASQYVFKKSLSNHKFCACLTGLFIFLLVTFSVNNFLLFYIGFECSVLPVLVLVLGWGYQPERITAGVYLLFYTVLASLPLLGLIGYMSSGVSCIYFSNGFYIPWVQGVVGVFMLGAFLVKFPMYSVHLWLPKAHVEAPVSGSMILAGVLLKLGGFGMIRFIPLISKTPYLFFWLIISISLMGGFYMSLVCMAQMDMKSLIACSSVVHMSGCVGSLLCFNDIGKSGCVLMMLAHGLCSSGLFFLTGLLYNMTGSRSFFINKGLLNILPSLSLWWFLLISCNMACPPTINLLSEIQMMMSLIGYSSMTFLPLSLMVFFSCVYGIFLFSLSQHGKFLSSKQSLGSVDTLSYLVLMLHWLPLNLFILCVFFLL